MLLRKPGQFVTPPVLLRITGSQFSPPRWRPLELGIRTPTLWCGPLSWGYGLPRFDDEAQWDGKR